MSVKRSVLTLSVSTRWNSEYFMIERFFELRSELAAVIVTHKNCPPMVDKACLTLVSRGVVAVGRVGETDNKSEFRQSYLQHSISIRQCALRRME